MLPSNTPIFGFGSSNIPIKSMNSSVGIRIANEIGVPILVDAPMSRFAGGPFLRIWVDIDVTKLLMRGKMILY